MAHGVRSGLKPPLFLRCRCYSQKKHQVECDTAHLHLGWEDSLLLQYRVEGWYHLCNQRHVRRNWWLSEHWWEKCHKLIFEASFTADLLEATIKGISSLAFKTHDHHLVSSRCSLVERDFLTLGTGTCERHAGHRSVFCLQLSHCEHNTRFWWKTKWILSY